MKLNLLASNLSKAVSTVGICVKDSKIFPVLENVCCVVNKGRLYIKSTDLRLTVITSTILMDSTIPDGTMFLLSFESLSKLLSTIGKEVDEILRIEVGEGFVHSVKWTTGKQKLSGGDAKLFPPKTKVDKSKAIGLKLEGQARQRFISALKSVAYACNTHDFNPALMGVNLVLTDEGFTVTASDGIAIASQLIKHPNALLPEGERLSYTLPKLFIAAIAKVNEEEKIHALTVTLTKSVATIEIGFTVMTCQLIDENYPNVSPILNCIDQLTTSLTVDKTALSLAISRAILTTDNEAQPITVRAFSGKLYITSTNKGTGTDTVDEIPFKSNSGSGPEMEFTISGSRMQKAIANLTGDTIELRMKDATSLILLMGEPDGMKAIIAPIKPDAK